MHIKLQQLTDIPRPRVGYIANEAHSAELAIIISYPISVSKIIVLLKNNQVVLLDLSYFALQEQSENNLMVVIFFGHGIMAHIP